MTQQTNQKEIRLSGHWNLSGVVLRIESLATLYHLEVGLNKLLCVDCSGIGDVDKSGLQLLHTWIQCVALRGVKPELINIPEKMRRVIRRTGLEKYFSEFYSTDGAGNHSMAHAIQQKGERARSEK